ncbi:MAG: hypothetical protein US95_C0034G0004 [Candidatus Woesebacteria bacterium GW2011_GWB1_38_5]|uniref:Tetratricopeptide repeat protein n=2 Tax=Candidatus Woeseibacteriota TaxID=1752722 RepID=A0A0G0K5P9_9BACT|nr:MAG: hypothetical protein US75_C0015G0034 [Candidatus Woesebacteria bacterium GW2011_GWC1_38_13]KKQ74102.1 MAG: hypothetical protein US95_C0034G0004 [Candidatus Woesebacteria bacterium GW2011_GWB1_38_5]
MVSKTTKNISAQEFHKLGEKLREEDRLQDAVDALTSAIVKYTIDKNYKGLIDALRSRSLTWKHLFLVHNKRDYLKLATLDARASLLIAKRKNIKGELSKCYFGMGEIYLLKKNYKKAVFYYKKSLLFYKGPLAEKGRHKYHLGEALYRLGRKKWGKEEMKKGLEEIEKGKGGVDSFVFNVWKSGCLMRLAELLLKDDSEKAKEFLKLAGGIVKNDKRLVIRKRQLQELKDQFKAQ